MLTDGRRKDGGVTGILIAHLGAFGSGELKRFCLIIAYTKNKGKNSSVKGLILTKIIGYRESMVLIICAENESNLTNRY